MQNGFRKNDIIDKRLMVDWDMSSASDLAESSAVIDILEQGGFNESAQFQLELTDEQTAGTEIVLTVSSCDTPDGTFVDTQTLTATPRADGEDMSWERVSCHCKRFIKVTPSVKNAEGAATTGEGKLRFIIAC